MAEGANRAPRVRQPAAVVPGEPPDLFPRDPRALECLLHSAHAHCDLFHRLREYRISRLLTKLLHRLRAHHQLPLLHEDGRFGTQPPAQAGDAAAEPDEEEEGGYWYGSSGGVASQRPQSCAVCAVCQEVVRRLYVPCWVCGHGCHMACFRRWFTSPDAKCPTIGCDCLCLERRSLYGGRGALGEEVEQLQTVFERQAGLS